MFGFGKGKIDLQIAKYNFSPGETIQGTIALKVKKTVKAKAVSVSLVGQQKTTNFSNNLSNTNQTKTAYVYYFRQPLDGEKDYLGDYNYNFQIKIPGNILGALNSTIGTLIKSAQILTGQSSQIKWYLITSLEIPWKIDITKKVQINIG